MSYILITESVLSSIGTILRHKLNTSSPYTPSEFISAINDILITDDFMDMRMSSSEITISNITKVCDGLFANAKYLVSINLPNCSYMGESAFYNNNGVRYIYSYYDDGYGSSTPIYSYSGGLSYISIPNCNYIGNYAFQSCTKLSSISLPNCSHIGYSAFQSCTSLSSISIPNCSYIGYNAFQSCTSLSSISIPNVSYINYTAFSNCYNLSSISIPNCSYIGDYAFYECSNLSYISIPNCSYIGNSAFYDCTKLESIYVLSTSIPTLSNITVFYVTPIETSIYLGYYGSIYVLSSMVNAFKTADNWSDYSDRITAYTGT